LLPAEDALLEQDLAGRAGVQADSGDVPEVCFGFRDARTEAAERERGPDHDRVAEGFRDGDAFVQVVADLASRDLGTKPGDDLLEPLAVLAGPDRVDAGTD